MALEDSTKVRRGRHGETRSDINLGRVTQVILLACHTQLGLVKSGQICLLLLSFPAVTFLGHVSFLCTKLNQHNILIVI